MTTATSLRVLQTEQDDPAFVDLVSRVLNATVECYNPSEVYVVQIDNWFGPGWKRFPAGLGSIARIWWFKSLIVPPFHPHRVKGQLHFRRIDPAGSQYEAEEVECLHLPYQRRPATKYRPLRRVTRSGVCLWYSGNTKSADRGSLMMYRIEREDEVAWYASFLKCGEWKIDCAKGVSPQKLLQLASAD